MYEKFLSVFKVNSNPPPHGGVSDVTTLELLQRFGGCSFNNGVYQILSRQSAQEVDGQIALAFPEFSGRVASFAADWLGRVFAEDPERSENGGKGIVMFEPGTAEALEIPCDIVSFHNEELIDYQEEALAASFYQQWLQSGGPAPRSGQCVGYKIPLYLNGQDEIDNLELSDFDVYWHVSSQLIRKTKGIPIGASIDNISIS